MIGGYRSFLMFWLGGASATFAASTASFVISSIVVYPAVDGTVSVAPAVTGSVKMNGAAT